MVKDTFQGISTKYDRKYFQSASHEKKKTCHFFKLFFLFLRRDAFSFAIINNFHNTMIEHTLHVSKPKT